MQEGRYSNGELRQTLTFYGEAAGKVAAELAPFTVTKAQHFRVLLEMLNQPNGLLTNNQCLDYISTLNNNSQNSILEVKNITPEWLAGMFDGDGGITVFRNEKVGRSRLELNITQAKCPALLKAIQALYSGTMATNPHRLKWAAADAIRLQGFGQLLDLEKPEIEYLAATLIQGRHHQRPHSRCWSWRGIHMSKSHQGMDS